MRMYFESKRWRRPHAWLSIPHIPHSCGATVDSWAHLVRQQLRKMWAAWRRLLRLCCLCRYGADPFCILR